MAVLSFLHLKNKTDQPKHEEIPKEVTTPSSRSICDVRNTNTRPMSFLFLKAKKTLSVKSDVVVNAEHAIVTHEGQVGKNDIPEKESCNNLFRIPAVMPTALLVSVNYCQGCDRFIPAVVEGYKDVEGRKPKFSRGAYGKCLRMFDSETGMESWKEIPATATVSKCFFMINWKGEK